MTEFLPAEAGIVFPCLSLRQCACAQPQLASRLLALPLSKLTPTDSTLESYDDVMSEPYDPYLPRGGSSANPSAPGGNTGPNPKTAAIQAQIDDTVGIMRDNITKVVERQERLDSLQDKTDNLAVSAQGFRRNANRVRKNMWWKDMKMRLIIGGAILVIIIIVVVSVVKATHH